MYLDTYVVHSYWELGGRSHWILTPGAVLDKLGSLIKSGQSGTHAELLIRTYVGTHSLVD